MGLNSKKGKYVFTGVMSVIAVVLIAMGINIEIKLYRLSQAEPVAVITVSTTEVETEKASNETYSFQNQVSEQTAYSLSDTTQMISASSVTEATESETQIQTQTQSQEIVTTAEPVTSSVAAPSQITQTTQPPTTQSVDADPNFYITASGKKYHKGECRYLSKSKILVTPDEIIEGGYEPCSICMKE